MDRFTNQVSFHDASLTGISRWGSSVSLSLEDISIGEGLCSATITVTNVKDQTRDGLQISGLEMETNDGEILTLNFDSTAVTLVVIWNKYAPRSNETHTYRLAGERVTIDIQT